VRRKKNKDVLARRQEQAADLYTELKAANDPEAVAKSEVELVMGLWLANNFRTGKLSGFEHWIDDSKGESYHSASANVSNIPLLPKGRNMTVEFLCNDTYFEIKGLVWALQQCGCRDVTEVSNYSELLSMFPTDITRGVTAPAPLRDESSCGLRTPRLDCALPDKRVARRLAPLAQAEQPPKVPAQLH
jgi:hypothetical protein